MRLALCQLNPTVGAIDDNADLVVDAVRRTRDAGAKLAVLPELVLSGYPASDLWLKDHFIDRCWQALERIAPELVIPTIVGVPQRVGSDRFNAAAWVEDGVVAAIYHKQLLPNYAVFDEHRWFRAGDEALVRTIPGADGAPISVGVTICEDAWFEAGPMTHAAALGADVIVNLSASPWRVGRADEREQVVRARAREAGTWIALCNQVGAEDGLVFDGGSLVAAPDGTIVARGRRFDDQILVVDLDLRADTSEAAAVELTREAELWEGLVLGLRDYVRKNGFSTVILGLSGGIDSAVVLALAVDALGARAVHAATMPSRFSSDATRSDAHAQAATLGVTMHELAIEPLQQQFLETLAPVFGGMPPDLTEENLQARIRGTLLMALSNKLGHLVLATGNRSEMSVGYATLYGDMNGGYAPIRDVPKTDVVRIARWRNAQAARASLPAPIPPSVIERPPTAELRAEQLDTDSLPDYGTLDAILELLVEHDRSVEETMQAGFDQSVVEHVQRLIDRAEYKRRQAPPGTRVTAKAFGSDRRMPITNGFDERLPARVP